MANLLQQKYGSQVYSVGILIYTGTVTAFNHWYGDIIKFNLNPSIQKSFGDLFQQTVNRNFMLNLRNGNPQLFHDMKDLLVMHAILTVNYMIIMFMHQFILNLTVLFSIIRLITLNNIEYFVFTLI